MAQVCLVLVWCTTQVHASHGAGVFGVGLVYNSSSRIAWRRCVWCWFGVQLKFTHRMAQVCLVLVWCTTQVHASHGSGAFGVGLVYNSSSRIAWLRCVWCWFGVQVKFTHGMAQVRLVLVWCTSQVHAWHGSGAFGV